MRNLKKAMAFDEAPDEVDSYIDKSPSNETGEPTPIEGSMEGEPSGNVSETTEGDGGETAILSSEMLGGQDLKPGSEIRLRIVSVSPEDGTVTVSSGGADKGIAKASKTYDLKGEI